MHLIGGFSAQSEISVCEMNNQVIAAFVDDCALVQFIFGNMSVEKLQDVAEHFDTLNDGVPKPVSIMLCCRNSTLGTFGLVLIN
jgi:hypothetical protein